MKNRKKANSKYCVFSYIIHNLWQILKCFPGNFCGELTLKLGGVSGVDLFAGRCKFRKRYV